MNKTRMHSENPFCNYFHASFCSIFTTHTPDFSRPCKRLNLFDNDLSGQLPSQLGALAKLHTVVVGSNTFSGSIPSTLGRINNLILHAEDNQISL